MSIEDWTYPIGRFTEPTEYSEENLKDSISAIQSLPGWLDLCIENLDEAQLKTEYRPGGWNIIQVIHHLADSHMNAYIRFKLALTEENPTIKPYDEKLWAELPDNFSVPVNISITLLHALHARWVKSLQVMTLEDWNRTYYHPENDEQTSLWQMTVKYAWHGRHHMEQIRTLRGRMNW